MSAIEDLADRGAAIVEQARKIFDAAPADVKTALKAGAALGVARTGARIAGGLARGNPGFIIAAAMVGAGVLAYSAYRKSAAAAPSDSADRDPDESEAPKAPKRRARKAAVDTGEAKPAKPRTVRKRRATKT